MKKEGTAKSATEAAVDTLVLTLSSSSVFPSKSALRAEEIEKKKRELEGLDAIKVAPASSDISDSEKRLKELEREKAAVPDSSSGSSSGTKAEKMAALQKRKEEAQAAIRSLSQRKIVPATDTSAKILGLEAEKEKYKKELSEMSSSEELQKEKDTAAATLDRLQRGIDVCFLMDCTGSMARFITATKEKIAEIITEVENIEATAIMRVAFVGYRDYCDGALQHEKVDFVEKADLEKIQTKLANCPAKGGGDGPEDIAGGLKIVTELSWYSSTRILIHFGDSPCHGSKYNGGMSDDYPGGDPKGLNPEELLKTIIKKRIDYYFMKITESTNAMIAVFQTVFADTGKEMYVNPIAANASDFVPKVIKSISSSMERSAAFKGIKVIQF